MGSLGTEGRSSVDATITTAGDVFRRLIVPIDYTMDSHRALGVALDLQRTHGSAVSLFHAEQSSGSDEWLGGIGSPSVGGDWIAEAKERLGRFIDNVAPRAAGHVELLASIGGDPVHELRRVAQAWNATMVVASAEVFAGLLRSPAERLIHGFGVPTLIIPRMADVARTAHPSRVAAERPLPVAPAPETHRAEERPPGRSFEDPSRPLGEDAIGAKDVDVADRAKVVGVLRKADELMANEIPSGRTREGVRRALELAAGRVGLSLKEYDAIVRSDDELMELERKVLAAHAH